MPQKKSRRVVSGSFLIAIWISSVCLADAGGASSSATSARSTPPPAATPASQSPASVAAQSTQGSAPEARAPMTGERRPAPQPGYLSPDAIDILKILPPAPTEGEPRYEAERKIFAETRKLEGTPRWKLATEDAEGSTAHLLNAFSCAVGVELTPANAPKVAHVAQKALRDTGRAVGLAKNHFAKKRPFQIDEGKTCAPAESVGRSYDYPSGHTVAGWTWALVLAEVAPDRASEIIARGRAYGDSRVVCGMHNPSAVEAGRLSGSAVMARVASEPAYRADIEAARQELDALRKQATKPDAARCEHETKLVAESYD